MRVNVWLPDELAATVKAELPELNVSQALQEALRRLLECDHDRLVCSACGEPLGQEELSQASLARFCDELLDRLEELVYRGGTAEGVGRVVRDLALRHQVRTRSLPGLSRARRRELAEAAS